MDTKSMTRKEFVTLTFTLLGGAATAAACSSSNNSTGTGGTNGAGGTTSANGCTSPLPEMQLPDQNMHTHTLSIPATDLDATSPMMVDTGVTDGHMHIVTLSVADMGTIKGGGMVDLVSSQAGTPAHMHTFRVSCTASTGAAGNGAAGTNGAAGNGAAGNHGGAGANGAAGTTGAAGDHGAAGSNGAAGH